MSIRLYKSYTPGTRNRALSSFSEITTDKPEKSLVKKNHRNKGRNNTTCRVFFQPPRVNTGRWQDVVHFQTLFST